MTVKLRLTLDVTYNSSNATELKNYLESLVFRAVGEGLLTGDSDAEVDSYEFRVEDLGGVHQGAPGTQRPSATALSGSHTFTLLDLADNRESPTDCTISVGMGGLCLGIAGYGDCCSTNDSGVVAHLEIENGDAVLRVFADINNEAPTHRISLAGAKLNNLIDSD